ncbi:MAG: hypothetical protein A4E70_01924 [Syntrophus sp. PtaU1.Bin005]|nr:MAG: hypothetical protein A4E70_01924 [Syntrophus sp. PtaU1.Bin005]
MEPDRVRLEDAGSVDGGGEGLPAVARKAGHQVYSDLESFPAQAFHGGEHIFHGVAPPGSAKDVLNERLGADFHGLYAMTAQEIEVILVNLVGPRGNPEAVDPAFPQKGLDHPQQAGLFLCRHSGEGPSVEGDLNRPAVRF